jgi:fucose permease
VVTSTAAFLAGLVLALFGTLRPRLAGRKTIGEGRVGWLLAAVHLALIPGALTAGLLVDQYGPRPILLSSSLLLAVALFTLALRADFASNVAASAGAGLGAAGVATAAVVLMPYALGFRPRELTASINLGFVFVALGTLVAPALADLLLRATDLRGALGFVSLLALVPGLAAAIAGKFGEAMPAVELASLTAEPRFWMLGLAFLLYAPLEFAVATWGATYLITDQGYSERRAAGFVWLFWLAFLASRLLLTAGLHLGILRETWAPLLVFLLALVASMALGNLAGGARARAAASALVMLGAALGPIFPTLTALTLVHFPETRGTAFGAMYAVGSLGSLLLMPLLAILVREQRVVRGLRLLAPLSLILVVVALAIWLR